MKGTIAGIAVGFLLAIAATALGAKWLARSPSEAHVIRVSGEGRLVGEPDLARLMFGVTKSGKTVGEAQQKMAETISKVITAVQTGGVTKEDITTSDVSIEQAWDYKRHIPSGYTVSSTLTITVRDVSRVGRVIDLAIATGLNRLQGVSYDVRSPEWRKKAFGEALADARDKAQRIAAGLGRPLGQVLSAQENGERQASPEEEYSPPLSTLFYAGEAMPATPRTRALPGRRALMVRVDVAYEL